MRSSSSLIALAFFTAAAPVFSVPLGGKGKFGPAVEAGFSIFNGKFGSENDNSDNQAQKRALPAGQTPRFCPFSKVTASADADTAPCSPFSGFSTNSRRGVEPFKGHGPVISKFPVSVKPLMETPDIALDSSESDNGDSSESPDGSQTNNRRALTKLSGVGATIFASGKPFKGIGPVIPALSGLISTLAKRTVSDEGLALDVPGFSGPNRIITYATVSGTGLTDPGLFDTEDSSSATPNNRRALEAREPFKSVLPDIVGSKFPHLFSGDSSDSNAKREILSAIARSLNELD